MRARPQVTAVSECAVQLCGFKNIDLFSQGIYQIRARAHGAAIRYSWGGGRLCNWQLMLARGEALRANPHDCMPVQMPPMPPERRSGSVGSVCVT